MSLTVKAFEPPTVGCQISPTTVYTGDTATVTATANSPQNRPITYVYSASEGTVSGSGPTATLSSAGAPGGPITVSCLATDDKGHTSSASASVTVRIPMVGPLPKDQPEFPWPLPKPSAKSKLPLQIGGPGLRKMGEIDQKLIAALDQMGYGLRAHYSIKGGFALVTQAEQIYANGRPKPPPARFSSELSGPHNLADYMLGLFTADPGYYRVIVFVVTNSDLKNWGPPPSKEEMSTLLDGPDKLPSAISVKTLPLAARCTALIYQFRKSGPDSAPALPIPSPLSTETHLRQAGLWGRLGLP